MGILKQSCRLIVPFTVLLLATVGILLLAINTEDVKEPAEYMYGIVLDAGSSHTAVFIYKWPADKQNGTGIVSQHSECHVEDGLSRGDILAIAFGVLFAMTVLLFSIYAYQQQQKHSKFNPDSRQNVTYKPATKDDV